MKDKTPLKDKAHKGLFDSITGTVSRVVEGLQLRLELFGVELQEEKQRFVGLLLLSLLTACAVLMALLSLHLLILLLFWEHHLAVVGVFLGVYVVAAVVLALLLRRRLNSSPMPFSTTVAEIRKDRQALVQHDE